MARKIFQVEENDLGRLVVINGGKVIDAVDMAFDEFKRSIPGNKWIARRLFGAGFNAPYFPKAIAKIPKVIVKGADFVVRGRSCWTCAYELGEVGRNLYEDRRQHYLDSIKL